MVHVALDLGVHRGELLPLVADNETESVQIHLAAAYMRRTGHDPGEGVVYLVKGDAVALQAAVAVKERPLPYPEGPGLVRREIVLRQRRVAYPLAPGCTALYSSLPPCRFLLNNNDSYY